MNRPQRIVRDRQLTHEEAQRFRAIREQVEQEKPEIAERLKTPNKGPKSWEDLYELYSLIDSLRAQRERCGLSAEAVAAQAGLEVEQITDLEAHRNLNPSISLLSHYASAVGQHLLLELAAAESATK